MRHKLYSAIALLFLLAAPAHAAERPTELNGVFTAESPYGTADFNWMWMDVYTSHLWTDAKNWSYAAPFALSITYDMNFSRKQLVEKSVDEVARIHGLPQERLAHLHTELSRLFPAVRNGDRITALFIPDTQVAFFHNGKETGRLTDKDLLIPFMDIWLSPKTERPELRKAMLGQ